MTDMKKLPMLSTLLLALCLSALPISQAKAAGLFGSIIAKIIKAIDLNIQKLQNKTLVLQNAQKVLENQLSKTKLGEITSWASKETALFSSYYEELAKVKAVLSTYQRVKDIMQMQISMISSYKSAFDLFKRDAHFTPEEISYMLGVYGNIIQRSVENTEELLMVTSSFKTKMSDGKRLEFINTIYKKMAKVQVDLLQFNRQNMQISLGRSATSEEAEAVKRYYGMP